MFSHHLLIQSRTNHHQKYSFHRLLATTTATNLNQRNNLEQAKSTRAYPNLCIVVNLEFRTQIFTIFFLYFLIFALLLCMVVCSCVVLCVILCFAWFNDFAIVITKIPPFSRFKKVTL